MNWVKHDKEINLNTLLSLLKEHKERTFKDLSKGIEVSNPTLTEYIKLLEGQNKIEHFDKAGDRRSQWYRIKPESSEQVTDQLGRYEAIRFIKGIPNPIHVHKKEGDLSVSAFVTASPIINRKEQEKRINAILDKHALRLLKVFLRLKPSKGKLALVIMLDSEKEGVNA